MGTEMNIGDFAAQTGLSVSAVRFYGDRGVLSPSRVDPTTGYRLYSSEQVETGVFIRDLRRINMSLADIEHALALGSTERHALVQSHLQSLEEELRRVTAVAERLVTGGPPSAKPTTETKTMPETTLTTGDIASALEQVLPAAGTDPSRPDLMTVLVEAADGSVRFVATDSHRCVVRDVVPTSFDGRFSAVLSATTMRGWQQQLDGSDSVTLRRDGGELLVTGERVDLRAAILGVTFPPYEEVLSSSASMSATVVTDRAALLDALSAFDGHGPVELEVSIGELTVSRGDDRRTIEATCESATTIAVNPSFAADAVRHAVGPEVVIEIDGPADLLVFRSADDGTYTSLLMPVKQDG